MILVSPASALKRALAAQVLAAEEVPDQNGVDEDLVVVGAIGQRPTLARATSLDRTSSLV